MNTLTYLFLFLLKNTNREQCAQELAYYLYDYGAGEVANTLIYIMQELDLLDDLVKSCKNLIIKNDILFLIETM